MQPATRLTLIQAAMNSSTDGKNTNHQAEVIEQTQCQIAHRLDLLTSHPAYTKNIAMKPRFYCMAPSFVLRILRVTRPDVPASVPPSTRPPPPRFLLLGFHRRNLSPHELTPKSNRKRNSGLFFPICKVLNVVRAFT